MTDLKMGFKNVILQRIQNSENVQNPTINLNQRKITDFSIKRILGDDNLSSKNDIKNNLKNLKTSNCNLDILDLSKNGHKNILNLNQNSFYDYYYRQMDIYHQKQFPSEHNQELIMSSDYLIKPKVYKFPNQYNNKLNNFNFKSDNLIGCELYFNNNNSINFYHHQNYYQYHHQSLMMNKDISNNNVRTIGNVVQPLTHPVLPNIQHQDLTEKCYTKFGGSLAVATTTNTTIATTLHRQHPNQQSDLKNYQKKIINLKVSSNLLNIDDQEISFKCPICDKVFGCANTLQSHTKTHKSPRYGCVECGKGFSQLRNYKYHLSVHRGTKEFAAKCPVCGKTFNDKGYLSSHMKIHRNKKEYECPYCPKSFNQRVAFNMHVRIHTGVKPHKCLECGKRFSRKMLLKQHMRTHSGEKPYQCSVCGKSFADRSNMTLHHRLHSGIKPFTCPICPKAFTKKHHLKTHLNYHTGCKPYVCPHLNCKQAFTQSSNMRTHAKKCQFKPAVEVIESERTNLSNTMSTVYKNYQ